MLSQTPKLLAVLLQKRNLVLKLRWKSQKAQWTNKYKDEKYLTFSLKTGLKTKEIIFPELPKLLRIPQFRTDPAKYLLDD